MTRQVEAVYEHGVFRPLEPLTLAEAQRVRLTISDSEMERCWSDVEFVQRAREEVAAMPHIPTIEQVQSILSKIPGSLAADFVAERED